VLAGLLAPGVARADDPDAEIFADLIPGRLMADEEIDEFKGRGVSERSAGSFSVTESETSATLSETTQRSTSTTTSSTSTVTTSVGSGGGAAVSTSPGGTIGTRTAPTFSSGGSSQGLRAPTISYRSPSANVSRGQSMRSGTFVSSPGSAGY
jgi:hypothetical protein